MKRALLIVGLTIGCSIVPSSVFASTCNSIGNTTYCSDGTTYSTIGNTTYGSDGTTYSSIGNTTYVNGPNGYSGTASSIGNTTYYNGTGGDSWTASSIGNTTYINGTNGYSGTISSIGNTSYGSGNAFNQCPANSAYNSSTGKCSCNYGYSVNYNKTSCTYTGTYTAPTTPTCPLNAFYNGSSCSCNYGYVASGGVCITNTQSCQNTYGSYSYGSGSSCYCDSGYAWNSSKTACVAQSYSYIPPPVAPTTYTASPSTTTYSCSSFGAGAVPKGSLCYCSAGYKWNSAITACIVGHTTLQRNLTTGSSGSDVVALKNLLAILNLYSGYVSTAFDANTATAVELFQASHGIPLTGTVGPMTRAAINALIGS